MNAINHRSYVNKRMHTHTHTLVESLLAGTIIIVYKIANAGTQKTFTTDKRHVTSKLSLVMCMKSGTRIDLDNNKKQIALLVNILKTRYRYILCRVWHRSIENKIFTMKKKKNI